LFDISCLYGTAEFDKIQNDTYHIWQKCHTLDPLESNLEKELCHEFRITLVGYHYFINDNGTLRPKFDFTSTGPTKGNSDAYVVATKAVDVPAPGSLHDVDWLELKGSSGKFADEVFRVDTRGGQPPTSVRSSPPYPLYPTVAILLYSATPDQVRSLSSMQQNTVSAHDLVF
jgi:hypothetical protein